MPSVKALEEKQKIVSEIKDNFSNAKSLVLFNYRGLTDKEIKDLRIKLKENDSYYKVYKNTLLRIAFKDLDLDFVRDYCKKIRYSKSPEEYLRENKKFITVK